MDATDALIASLSEQLTPVRRLAPPSLRAASWVALATALVAAFCLVRGLRPDLSSRVLEPSFLTAVAAAWATGALATLAAFEIGLPDRRQAWLLAPLPALLLWVSGISYGCLGDWVAIPAGAPLVAGSVRCLETLLGTSIPLALVLWRMLRQARPLRPANPAWMGALAVAAFADTAHLLIHPLDATALVLVMNLGVAAIIVGCAGAAGARRLSTRH
jgi:hypothetical protein